jgi:hypothetical protein
MHKVIFSTSFLLAIFFLIKLSFIFPIYIKQNKIDPIDDLQLFLEPYDYKSKRVLSNYSHILEYYFMHDFDSLSSLNRADPKFYQRRNSQYINIEDKLKNRTYDIVIISTNSDFNEISFNKLIDFGYKEYKIVGFNIYISLSILN